MRSVSRENAGYSKRQVQKHLGYIGAIFKVAKVYNPGTDLDKPRVKRGKVTFFYHSEVERIREHLGEQDSARVLVMSRIGLRRGEIVALRWMDVDFSGEQVHVRKNYVEGEEKDPKDHEVRSVPLQEDALQALAALSLRERFTDSSDLVFPRWDGCHQDPDGLSKRFRKAKQATGLDRGTLEHLRHTFATYACDTPGVTPADVQKWLGHEDIATNHALRRSASEEGRCRPALGSDSRRSRRVANPVAKLRD